MVPTGYQSRKSLSFFNLNLQEKNKEIYVMFTQSHAQ